ncbi:MAG: hypothetical protein V7K21_08260 [Nostoc sp.]
MEAAEDGDPKTLTSKLLTTQHSVKSQSSGFCRRCPEGVRQSHLNLSLGASLSQCEKGSHYGLLPRGDAKGDSVRAASRREAVASQTLLRR